jgi:hypothetical protein
VSCLQGSTQEGGPTGHGRVGRWSQSRPAGGNDQWGPGGNDQGGPGGNDQGGPGGNDQGGPGCHWHPDTQASPGLMLVMHIVGPVRVVICLDGR